MNILRYSLLIIFVLLMIVLPAAAQGDALSQTVDLGDGSAISVPDDWDVQMGEDGSVVLMGDELQVLIYSPTALAALVDYDADADMEDIFATVSNELFEFDPDPTDIGQLEFDNRTDVYASFVDENDNEVIVALAQIDEGIYGFIHAQTEGQMTEDLVGMLRAVDESFIVMEGAGAACTITAAAADSALVHVGPGENRSSVAYLAADQKFTVTGRFETDDGAVWYQLDKEQAAPGMMINEAWVAAANVEATGGCETVGEAAAPPIIPMVNVPLPAPETAPPTGDENTGEAPVEESAPAASEGGIIPRSGTWDLVSNSFGDASCEGASNVRMEFPPMTGTFRLTVRGDGSSFTDGSDVFTRTMPGQYKGSFTTASDENTQLYLTANSPNQMVGYFIYNFTRYGTPCSATIGVQMNRQ